MTNEPIITNTATVSLGDDGVLRVVVLPGAKETVESAWENIEALIRLSNNVKRPLLVDNRLGLAIDRQARRIWDSDQANAIISCTGILVKPGISRAIGNFMIGVLKPNRAHKLFDNEAEALKWLTSFIK